MLKGESRPALASPATLETTPVEQPIDSGSIGRLVTPRDIGFVGLGRMGTAMAANLAGAGVNVTAMTSPSHPPQGAGRVRRGAAVIGHEAEIEQNRVVVGRRRPLRAQQDLGRGPVLAGDGGLAVAGELVRKR